jgi:hypothetical protein
MKAAPSDAAELFQRVSRPVAPFPTSDTPTDLAHLFPLEGNDARAHI